MAKDAVAMQRESVYEAPVPPRFGEQRHAEQADLMAFLLDQRGRSTR